MRARPNHRPAYNAVTLTGRIGAGIVELSTDFDGKSIRPSASGDYHWCRIDRLTPLDLEAREAFEAARAYARLET